MSDNAFFTAAVLLCAKVVSAPIQPVRSGKTPRCGRPRLRRGRPFFACEKSAPHSIRLNSLILTLIINRTPNRRPLVPIAAIFIRCAGTRRERPDYILFIRRSHRLSPKTRFYFFLSAAPSAPKRKSLNINPFRRPVEPKAEIFEDEPVPPLRRTQSGKL